VRSPWRGQNAGAADGDLQQATLADNHLLQKGTRSSIKAARCSHPAKVERDAQASAQGLASIELACSAAQ
jgi:hypothetical protein